MADQEPEFDWQYQGVITLKWEGEVPPDLPAIEAAVIADIRNDLGMLDRPEALSFHIVSLTEDSEGPSVDVFGRKDSPFFHCLYSATTEWEPLHAEGTNWRRIKREKNRARKARQRRE